MHRVKGLVFANKKNSKKTRSKRTRVMKLWNEKHISQCIFYERSKWQSFGTVIDNFRQKCRFCVIHTHVWLPLRGRLQPCQNTPFVTLSAHDFFCGFYQTYC